MVSAGTRTVADVRALLERVVDPELPFLSIADLAILRDVALNPGGIVTVTITPTYSGCPALGAIAEDIVTVLTEGGFSDVQVDIVHRPPWSTEWMSEDAKAKLAANRIAPPGPLGVVAEVLCPLCSADTVRTVAEFGSTACKSLMVCTRCGEPFDRFKSI
ncbi:MAG: phenylacetate-CoA oxygenase subunit PaaJ [Acidimicrobiia bacterium]|nr:MAG: phenylacetate-CoA oxygenase subunit PaaJ [Acidimicrobiia bacterium]